MIPFANANSPISRLMSFMGLVLTTAFFAGAMAETSPQTPTSTSVVVDRLVVDGETNINESFVESLLEIPFGAPIDRAEFEERLLRFRLKLDSLAYFKSVDVSLEKGRERNHYVVHAVLASYRAFYSGVALGYQEGERVLPFFKFKANGWNEKAFVGSRNLFGSGIMADFELSHIDLAYELGEIESSTSLDTATLSLYSPELLSPDFYAGLKVFGGPTDTRVHKGLPSDKATSSQHMRGMMAAYEVQLGRRWGLVTTGLIGGEVRQAVSLGKDSATLKTNSSYLGFRLRYAEKSYLAAVEPGTVLGLDLTRTIRPNMPIAKIEALHTFALGNQALTPKLNAVYVRLPTSKVRVLEQVQGGILYEWISPWDWVFGLSPSALGGTRSKPAYGVLLSASYWSPSFLVKLEVSLGAVGFDEDRLQGRRGAAP